ncbi:MAG: pheromone autoinducer 2 transporter [Alphaproteobacteria bacterium ADurb.Bin438]|nr:MAG: pheromone autoinducer 2 transporter [Alphaproteobacteria bacterium ADurb.Bin438]
MNKAQKLMIWILVIAFFVFTIGLLKNILLPFVAGILLAYLVDPIVTKLQKYKLSRTTATTIVSIICTLIFILALIIVVPLLRDQILKFSSNLPLYTAEFIKRASEYFPEEIIERFKNFFIDNANEAVKFTIGVIKNIFKQGIALFNILSLIFITPVVAFYMLKDFHSFTNQIKALLPVSHRNTIINLLKDMDIMINGFIRGQSMVCLIIACYYSITLSLIGFEFGLLLGIFCGFITFIPYVGWSVGFITSLLLAIASMTSDTDYFKPIAVCVIFAISQLCESNLLIPMLVGDKVKLHPVWVIFALLAGGTLFGFVGVLISLPVAAAVGVLVRFAISVYFKSSLYESK